MLSSFSDLSYFIQRVKRCTRIPSAKVFSYRNPFIFHIGLFDNRNVESYAPSVMLLQRQMNNKFLASSLSKVQLLIWFLAHTANDVYKNVCTRPEVYRCIIYYRKQSLQCPWVACICKIGRRIINLFYCKVNNSWKAIFVFIT